MLKYEIILYWSHAGEAFIAEVPEFPGCTADGKTYKEALANVEIIIQEWLETAKELGRPIPAPAAASPSLKHALQQFLQGFSAQARIAHYAFQDFGMQNFRRVKWNRSPLAFGILVDLVAATLARHRKSQLFQDGTDFAGCQAWELGH